MPRFGTGLAQGLTVRSKVTVRTRVPRVPDSGLILHHDTYLPPLGVVGGWTSSQHHCEGSQLIL
jgi:hypothetical protein